MVIATIRVSGVDAVAVDVKKFTAGIIGAEVVMEYSDPMWDGLQKKVVFDGAETVAAIGSGDMVTIPVEAVSYPGVPLRVGVYGVSYDGSLAIPTIWAELGKALPAVPGKPVGPGNQAVAEWAQILGMIGDLRNLNTADKSNLVAAVNEAMRNTGGGAGGGLNITDDENGNVTISSTGSVSITDDGEGNVTIV